MIRRPPDLHSFEHDNRLALPLLEGVNGESLSGGGAIEQGAGLTDPSSVYFRNRRNNPAREKFSPDDELVRPLERHMNVLQRPSAREQPGSGDEKSLWIQRHTSRRPPRRRNVGRHARPGSGAYPVPDHQIIRRIEDERRGS